MKFARAAIFLFCLSLLPVGASATVVPLAQTVTGRVIHVAAGETLRARGPLMLNAMDRLVVDGTVLGAAGEPVTMIARTIVVRGRVLGGAGAQGERGGDVTLRSSAITIAPGALVASGNGGSGANATDRMFATASDGARGGDIILKAAHVSVLGTLRLGHGGAGGAATAFHALAGAGGDAGNLLYDGSIDAIRDHIVAGHGGDGGIAVAIPESADPTASQPRIAAACGALNPGKPGRRPANPARPAKPVSGPGTDGTSITANGSDGTAGGSGGPGSTGPTGSAGTIIGGTGGPGTSGCPGSPGGDGTGAQALGGGGGDSTLGTGGKGGDAAATGGKGGPGGAGGKGGNGGQGGPGTILGGQGGPGGGGGIGGPGGNGGPACADAGKGGSGPGGSGADGTTTQTGGEGGAGGAGGPGGNGGPGGAGIVSLLNGVPGLSGATGTAGAAGATGAVGSLPCLAAIQVSSDPFSGGAGQHKTQVEPDSYAFGSTIVYAFQTARINDGGSMDIGWATSNDDGRSWSFGFLPGITPAGGGGPYDRATDPSVAYDAKHDVWIISSLPHLAGVGWPTVLASRSLDGGRTWVNPTNIGTNPIFDFDKNWITCDNWPASPHYGNCYTEVDNPAQGNLMYMSTSSDGGATWSTPISPAGNPSGIGGQPLVQPNGNVVVPYAAGWSPQLSFRSTNGGASWEAPVLISNFNYHSPAGNLRSPPLASAEVDGSGKIYVTWMDCRFRSGCAANDIVMSTSTDGLSWTSPVRIPIDATDSNVDHFLPGIGVDRATSGSGAHLFLVHYMYPKANCSSSTCTLQVGFGSSVDGGASWTFTSNPHLMAMSWVADSSQGKMVGDYFSASFLGNGRAFPIFTLAYDPSGAGAARDQEASTIEGGFDVTASDGPVVPARNDPVLWHETANQASVAPRLR